jgi:hypothetical protein
MTREEFIENFIKTEAGLLIGDRGVLDAMTILTLSMIGSIHDLQQQIADLQEKIDERS